MKIKKITRIGKNPVYDISVRDHEHYVLENGVVTHNTGGMYSANQVLIITKAQDKDGKELLGYNFTINIEKSRYVREKSKFPFNVKFEGGINKWSGLLDIAIDGNFIVKPNMGWYSKVNQETGEIEEKKYRMKETNNTEFWSDILTNPKFNDYVMSKYSLSKTSIVNNNQKKEYEVDDESDV